MQKALLPRLIGSVAGLAMMTGVAVAQESVEVLHWWTSGGEAAALNVLKDMLEKEGVAWQDMPVAGGGGEQAMTVLRSRATSGNPPTAAQMLGFDILDWAQLGVVGNLNDLAATEGWDKVIPAALQNFSKYDGNWIAAPVNIHSTNWMWANKAVLRQGRRHRAADQLGRADRRARQAQGERRHPDRAWRPALAGRHRVRGRRRLDRRAGILQEGAERLRSGGARLRHDEDGVRPHDAAARLFRRQLLGPRLEPLLAPW